jgi:hypothetical protein
MLATLLNGTIVAGMIVLLRHRRTARVSAELEISRCQRSKRKIWRVALQARAAASRRHFQCAAAQGGEFGRFHGSLSHPVQIEPRLLPKTGVFQTPAGDHRRLRSENGQSRSLET